jgi:hypothetical protein
MANQTLNVYRVRMPDGLKDVVSLLPMEAGFSEGLAPEAIVGVSTLLLDRGQKMTPENFVRNRVFVEFLHDVIARCGPEIPALQAEAREQGDGCVFMIDGRTPDPQGNVPPHDIIGAFEVKAGGIVSGSYKANHNHVLLSQDGFFQLDAMLFERLMDELAVRNKYCLANIPRTTPATKPCWKFW